MTNYAQIWLILAICGRIYGQKWQDVWPNEIASKAVAMVAMPDFTSTGLLVTFYWDTLY